MNELVATNRLHQFSPALDLISANKESLQMCTHPNSPHDNTLMGKSKPSSDSPPPVDGNRRGHKDVAWASSSFLLLLSLLLPSWSAVSQRWRATGNARCMLLDCKYCHIFTLSETFTFTSLQLQSLICFGCWPLLSVPVSAHLNYWVC